MADPWIEREENALAVVGEVSEAAQSSRVIGDLVRAMQKERG